MDIKKRSYLFFTRLVIGLILFITLIYTVGIEDVINTFRKINPPYAFFILFSLFALFLIGAVNIWLLLTIFYPIPFLLFLRHYAYCWMASLLTPGQVGDASLIILFKRKFDVAIQDTTLVYFTDKAITLMFFLFIGSYGAEIIVPELNVVLKPIAFLLLILLPFLVLLICKKIINKLNEGNNYGNLNKLFLNWKIVLLNGVITVSKWFVVCGAYYFSFLTFGIKVPWPEIGIIPVLSTLVGYVPISIAGIGTVEITAGYLFSQVGVETSIVLSAYLLLRLLQYLLALLMLATTAIIEQLF